MFPVKLVVDTSVVIKWLSKDNEKYLDRANKILTDAQDGNIILIAPELVKYEAGNVLLFSKKLSFKQAEFALTQFFNLPITFITQSEALAKETFLIAKNLGITYYDALFLSLAKQYNATLVTDNIKHQGKTSDIKVVSLKDY